jgi:hypothetical protein
MHPPAPSIIDACLASYDLFQAVTDAVPLDDRDDLVAAFVSATENDACRTTQLLAALLHCEHHTIVARNDLHSFLRSSRFPSLGFDALVRRDVALRAERALAPVADLVAAMPTLPEEAAWPTPLPSPISSMAGVPTEAELDVPSISPELEKDVDAVNSALHAHLEQCFVALNDALAQVFPETHKQGFFQFMAAVQALPTSAGRSANVTSYFRTVLASVVCLRVVCPLMLNASRRRVDAGPSLHRRFVLFTKIVQKVANGALFEMTCARTALKDSMPELTATLQLPSKAALCSPALSAQSPEFLCAFNDFVSAQHAPFFTALMTAMRPAGQQAASEHDPSTGYPSASQVDAAAEVGRIASLHMRPIIQAFAALSPWTPNPDLAVHAALGTWRREEAAIERLLARCTPPALDQQPRGLMASLFSSRKSSRQISRQPSRDDVANALDSTTGDLNDSKNNSVSRSRGATAHVSLPELFLRQTLCGVRAYSVCGYPTGPTLHAKLSAAISISGNCVVISEEALRTAQAAAGNQQHSASAPDAADLSQRIDSSASESSMLAHIVKDELTTPRGDEAASPRFDASPSPPLSPPGPTSASASDAAAAAISARLWAAFNSCNPSEATDRISIAFVTFAGARHDRKDWGFSWVIKLLDELPSPIVDCIDKVYHVRPALVHRVMGASRRFSFSGRKTERKVVNVDSLDSLPGDVLRFRLLVPSEHLVRTPAVPRPVALSLVKPHDPLGPEAVRRLQPRLGLLRLILALPAARFTQVSLERWAERDRQSVARTVEDELSYRTGSDVALNLAVLSGVSLAGILIDLALLYREQICDPTFGVFPAQAQGVLRSDDGR